MIGPSCGQKKAPVFRTKRLPPSRPPLDTHIQTQQSTTPP
ncbi:hypothetical protein HMPREF9440_00418 [Sutterella parvirubra YIT 11816]|uniref:Uncharacterized protein n=1 Tax=Sutterella parvirubra YIT 11816 TaxID=762967 RepID=H3KCG6_9BURK|nr:hypothetical protein HMPREF9440_00418 [Sutterella parvirubra YIT 11816]